MIVVVPAGAEHREAPAVVKLYLDDLRSEPDETWTLARTAEEARAILLAGPVECASLDCDMGECAECESSFPARGYPLVTATCRHRMSGLELVEWMAATGTWPKFKPAVHSANQEKAPIMRAIIERSWRRPA